MSERKLKEVLKDCIELEIELLDFVDECLKDIFKEDYESAKWRFEEEVECIHSNGCLQSLQYIRSQIEADKKRSAENRAKHACENSCADDDCDEED